MTRRKTELTVTDLTGEQMTAAADMPALARSVSEESAADLFHRLGEVARQAERQSQAVQGQRAEATTVYGDPFAPPPRAPERTEPASEVWQARVRPEFGAKLLEDAQLMGLASKTEVVKAALTLWHRHVAEERMARGVEAFYGDQPVPLPAGVLPLDPAELDDDPES